MDKKLFCYSCPNTMDGYLKRPNGHKYTDDVAICYADDLEDAINIFSRLYKREYLIGYVQEVKFNDDGIYIATDY